MSDSEHSGNEMEQEEHVDDLAEDEEAPQAVVKSGYLSMRKIREMLFTKDYKTYRVMKVESKLRIGICHFQYFCYEPRFSIEIKNLFS